MNSKEIVIKYRKLIHNEPEKGYVMDIIERDDKGVIINNVMWGYTTKTEFLKNLTIEINKLEEILK